MMRLHASLTIERVTQAVDDALRSTDNPGFCRACGAEAAGAEPDATGYHCDDCGADEVCGAEEILMQLAIGVH